MTSPQIGNYGVTPDDIESNAPKVAGFIMREESPVASNWRASGTLRDYLIANNVVAIADIDTRELTRLLRSSGVMRGVIATGDVDAGDLVQQARAIPNMEGTDLVREVTCAAPFDWPGAVDKTSRSGPSRPRAARRRRDPSGRCASPPTISGSSGTS